MATVVSAFFKMSSKFPEHQYLYWIKEFLENISCSLVFYTDKEYISLFTEWRGDRMKNTVFIPFDFKVDAFKKYKYSFWEKELDKDTEYDYFNKYKKIHSPELYAIWYEKKEFVLKAIELNPFQHDKFMWCDAGGFRIPEWFPQINSRGIFPNADLISDKFLIFNIEPFTKEELLLQGELSLEADFSNKARIGGGYLAATSNIWKIFSENYDIMLNKYIEKGKFVGKDQNIIASMYIENPSFFNLIETDKSSKDAWLWPQIYLGQLSNKIPDKTITDKTITDKTITDKTITDKTITVLIPLYNGIEYLKLALESVCKQTYSTWKVLIGVNGYSQNSEVYQQTKKIVELFLQKYRLAKEKIQVIDLFTSKGKSESLNTLLTYVETNWISLLDVDDFWMPTKLEHQIQFIDDFDVIGTQCEYFDELHGYPNIPFGDITNFDFFSSNPIINSSILMKKQYAYWSLKTVLEDYELWLKLRYKYRLRFYNIPEILVGHRIHKKSAFNNTNSINLLEFLEKQKEILL